MFITIYKWKQVSFQCFEFVLQTTVVYIVDYLYTTTPQICSSPQDIFVFKEREYGLPQPALSFFCTKNFFRKENDMELKKRLSDYIKNSGLKKQFVAEKIGIPPSKLSYYLHGKLFVTDDFADKIKTYLESVGA